MAGTVMPFRNANDEPEQGAVEILKDVLAMAERGEIRSVALAASMTGHKTFTAYETRDLQEAIGLVGFLHHDLCARQRETVED